jgi:excinuclease ABC subunit B
METRSAIRYPRFAIRQKEERGPPEQKSAIRYPRSARTQRSARLGSRRTAWNRFGGSRIADCGSRPLTLFSVPLFKIHSEFQPAGDQPAAIARLAEGVNRGDKFQTLLGITGSGKSATMAWTIEAVQRPTIVIAPNKALAAQLANEFRQFFPENRVEYFVSYYDYYQPEAYLPQTDTYIEKDATVNDEIDRLRHAATSALLVREDVIIVASVSCIYGLGSPEQYEGQLLRLFRNVEYPMKDAVRRLIDIGYERNEVNLIRGKFRVRGDTLEVMPSYEETVIRFSFFGDTVERILRMNPVTGEVIEEMSEVFIFPATHYVTERERMVKATAQIEEELAQRLAELEAQGKMLEAQRLRMRTSYDLEMMREVGFCTGIENYSRFLDGREPGEAPYTLLDYFPDNYLTIIDESHVTVPQIGGQFEGDHSRKTMLVEHGFRLPSAMDNRPLRFDEWLEKANQIVFLSATPSAFELSKSTQIVEQIVRPTGLVDPEVVVRPTRGQIDDLLHEIRLRAAADQRVLVTTLTKKMAEDLTDYLLEMGVRARYLHSEIDTLERVAILRELRLGEFDVLVGINLLREGLDLPEVSLVAILDADKEGFLRSETSLIQIIGRAARNVDGQVVMYADKVTDSMQRAINETNRRRGLQARYNEEHGIDPQTIRKKVSDILELISTEAPSGDRRRRELTSRQPLNLDGDDLVRLIMSLEDEMHEAAKELRFEYAARLRDEVNELKRELKAITQAVS